MLRGGGGGGGGGGGDQPEFFVKLLSDIAIDQQTRTREQTFEGGPGLHPSTGAHGTTTPSSANPPQNAQNPNFG